MFEDFNNVPDVVQVKLDVGLTPKQREELQRACGLVEFSCYITETNVAEALTYAMEIIDGVLSEDASRKRGVPSE